MNDVLSMTIVILAVLAAVFALVLAALDRRINWWLLGLLGVVEVALLVQFVFGIVQLIRTDQDVSGIIFVGYLIGTLAVLPLGALWALAEKSRWGAGALAIACLIVPVLVLRLEQIWSV
ncbi:hypothetical protein [Kribbella deserti]|uniref:Integral membrane protein n=1 Tax=Kribbella deserti TaxID=1926257 RepID=A0ABV6QR78_9ACTN